MPRCPASSGRRIALDPGRSSRGKRCRSPYLVWHLRLIWREGDCDGGTKLQLGLFLGNGTGLDRGTSGELVARRISGRDPLWRRRRRQRHTRRKGVLSVSPVQRSGWSCQKPSSVRANCLRALCRFVLVRLIAETTPADASLACKEAATGCQMQIRNSTRFSSCVLYGSAQQRGRSKRCQCERMEPAELDRRVRQGGLTGIVYGDG